MEMDNALPAKSREELRLWLQVNSQPDESSLSYWKAG